MSGDTKQGKAAGAFEADQFRVILEAMPNAIVVIDRDRRIARVNRRAEELFLHDRDDLAGTPVEALVPERFRERHPALVAGFFADPATRPMGAGRDLYARRSDGSEFPVEIGLNPFDIAGEPHVLASIIDITERKRAQEVHDRLAAIVEGSDDAIIAKSTEGTILSWNRGAERLYGYDAGEAVGQPVFMLIPESGIEDEARLLARIRDGEHVEHFETLRQRKDGSLVHVSVSLSPLRDGSGKVVGTSSIVRDITDAKLRDAELRRSNAELEQFAYVASHDLQEPLRMVANYVELLASRYRGKLDDRADVYIGFASDGARRMQRLVSDLLAYSRIGSEGKPLRRVDSGAVLDQVLRSLEPLIAEHGAEVTHEGLPRVLADESQLGQLFQNLVANAIKFRSKAPPRVRVTAERQGEDWAFAVSDNGIGIDMKFADRVFQMFQRLHDRGKYPGSGIGLAIAKRIVERHGGRIRVESAPGAGSTFHFTLRAAPGGPR